MKLERGMQLEFSDKDKIGGGAFRLRRPTARIDAVLEEFACCRQPLRNQLTSQCQHHHCAERFIGCFHFLRRKRDPRPITLGGWHH